MVSSRLTHLPGIGPWFSRIGNVSNMMAMPCSPTDQMWTQGFFTSIPYLVWSLFKPDPIDATLTRFGMPGSTHRLGRWKNAHSIRGLLGPGLPGARRTAWWTLGELGQRVGWWFCIIDAGTNFAVNWVSAAYQYAGCFPENLPDSYGVTDSAWVTVPGEFGYVPFNTITDPGHRLGYAEILFRQGVPKGYAISAQAQPWAKYPNIVGTVSMDIRIKGTGIVLKDFGSVSTQPGKTFNDGFHHGNYGRYLKDYNYSIGLFYHNTGGGYVDLQGCTFQAKNAQGNSILEDPL